MRTLICFLVSLPLAAQNYASYNNQPVVRTSFLRHQRLMSSANGPFGDSTLIGYWPFDEGTGRVALDFSGNANNATWQGPQNGTYREYWSPGKVSRWAGAFSSGTTAVTEAFVTCGTNVAKFQFGTVDFSVSGWVFGVAANSAAVFGVSAGANGSRFALDFFGPASAPANTISGFFLDSSTHLAQQNGGASSVALNTWTLLTMVVSRATNLLALYVNGVLSSSTSASGVTGSVTPQGSCIMGGVVNGNTPTLGGLMNDVRIYNRALSGSEIQAIYNAENH